MRLVFSPYDTDRLEAAQCALLDGFAAWARRSGRTLERVSAEAVLDYKGAADGLLGRWTADTLTHLCAEWLPSKITLPEADWPRVPGTLHAWIDYLDDAGLLDARSDPPRRLHTAVDGAAAAFHAAMADPSRFGVTKFWMTTMLDHGIDLDDEAQRDAFFDDLRAGRLNVDMSTADAIAERQVSESTVDDTETTLPLVALPGRETLTPQAASTPAVTHLRTVMTWLGDGRVLTRTGASNTADLRALAAALRPGPGSGDGEARVTGAGPWLRWARAARIVRAHRGRLVPVRRAAGDLRDPLALWDRAFAALPALGPAFRAPGDRRSPVTDDLGTTVLTLLAPLYSEGAPLPLAALAELVWESAADTYDLADPGRFRAQIDAELDRVLAALTDLGAIRRTTTDDPDLLDQLGDGIDDPPTEAIIVELTGLGARGVNHRARAIGWDAPTVDDLAEETAEVLIATVAEADPDLLPAATDAWASARPTADAELTELAARTDDPVHHALAAQARERVAGRRG